MQSLSAQSSPTEQHEEQDHHESPPPPARPARHRGCCWARSQRRRTRVGRWIRPQVLRGDGHHRSSLSAPRLGNLQLIDGLSGYWDRVTGSPTRTETLTVAGTVCTSSTVTFYGATENWANEAPGVPQQGRLRLDCTYRDGTKHQFYWEMSAVGVHDSPRTNCLALWLVSTTR
jgi:hypothetical protein